ncbi:MAG: hypothetical protein DI535_04825 [Citrobacter freundii]|nr:MAG: hypothetical protein DI535_04825 [Citrobacter freundii]
MREEQQYEEAQLLRMLANDSQYAFQLLFNKYKNHIYKVAGLYLKTPSLAEEVLQDVFMKVWLNRQTLVNLNSFESWLFTVSKNHILNYNKRVAAEWKAQQRYRNQQAADNEDTTDHKVRTNQYNELLQKAVSRLPEQQQAVYRLAKDQQLSYQEIGELMSISPLTVKTHMTRALNSIRAYLKAHDEHLLILLLITGTQGLS